MKPKLIYRHGFWWCIRLGVVGQGITPLEAYEDMWKLYTRAIHESMNKNNHLICPVQIRY